MFDADRIVATIDDLVAMAPRSSGTVGGAAAAEYVRQRFEQAGLDEVWIEETPTYRWTAQHVELRVGDVQIAATAILHSNLPAHDATGCWSAQVSAPVVDIGRDRVREHDVHGRIVLFDLRFTMTLASLLPLARYVHDPDRQMMRRDVLGARNPYITTLSKTMREAREGGAVAVIGVLADYPESLSYHNEYYRRSLLELPGVWVTRAGGEQLRQQIRDGRDVMLRLDSERQQVPARTVLGLLRGSEPDTVMVQSHHDSVGPGAVEDASGVAEVVALAEREGLQARSVRRRKTLLFVTFDSHFTGYQAHQDFARRYALAPDSPYPLALNLCIEHIGLRAKIGPDGGFETLTDSEPRAFFAAVSASMTWSLIRAIRRRGLGAASVLGATLLELVVAGIPTDASFVLGSGIPTISLVSGPLYLYADDDTIDKVDVDQLVPVAQVFTDLIDAADARPGHRLGLLPRALRRRLPRGHW